MNEKITTGLENNAVIEKNRQKSVFFYRFFLPITQVRAYVDEYYSDKITNYVVK